MRIFNYLILALEICYSQNSLSFSTSDGPKVLDSLQNLLNKNNILSGSYKLDSYNHLNNKINYKYYDEIKIVDTVLVNGLNQITGKIKERLIKPYKSIPLGEDYEKIGVKIMSENYFINQKPIHTFGLTKNKMLGAIITFKPDFQSHFSGNIGFSKRDDFFQFNGEINVHMENLTKSTGTFDVNWKKIETPTQHISFNIYEPYMLGSNLGIIFFYYRGIYNGLYTNLENKLKFEVSSSKYSNFNFGFLRGSTTPTKEGISKNYAGVRYEGFSISFDKNLLNNRLLPTSGRLISFEGDFGLNDNIIFTDLSLYYNNYFLITKSLYSKIKFNAEGLNVLIDKVPKSRYKNYGGSSTLRGYNDNQFMNTQFSISTIELSYILSSTLHPFLFLDLASKNFNVFEDTFIGYGFGFKNNNKNILLNFSYAFSKEKILFSEGVLHMKVISKF